MTGQIIGSTLKVRTARPVRVPPAGESVESPLVAPALPKALKRMNLPENDTPERIRADLLAHFAALGLSNLTTAAQNGVLARPGTMILDKDGVRTAHKVHRADFLNNELKMTGRRWSSLLSFFADGAEIDPARIEPVLVPVDSSSQENELFRFATTLWSVPVSRGFGRRMRYLVMDAYHHKVIGLFALGDPVFNLRARDELVGWDQAARRERLVGVMDGYIIGSVPPYSSLLGGKLVTSLIGSRTVSQEFRRKYGGTEGIISGRQKEARLALVTVTSALGRSSIYNRLHLRGQNGQTLVRLDSIGMTDGYGHFHLSEELFGRMRRMLLAEGHPYALKHQFGDGPNWRMRLIRVALSRLDLSPNLVRHGISREVFAMPLIANYQPVLKDGQAARGVLRPSVQDLSEAALQRWILPRAASRPEYRTIRKEDYLQEQLARMSAPPLLM